MEQSFDGMTYTLFNPELFRKYVNTRDNWDDKENPVFGYFKTLIIKDKNLFFLEVSTYFSDLFKKSAYLPQCEKEKECIVKNLTFFNFDCYHVDLSIYDDTKINDIIGLSLRQTDNMLLTEDAILLCRKLRGFNTLLILYENRDTIKSKIIGEYMDNLIKSLSIENKEILAKNFEINSERLNDELHDISDTSNYDEKQEIKKRISRLTTIKKALREMLEYTK